MIAYANDTTPQFEIGTVATHSCIAGYTLVGDMTRTCEDDDQADIVGVWSGSAPTCERKQFESRSEQRRECVVGRGSWLIMTILIMYSISSLQQSNVPH